MRDQRAEQPVKLDGPEAAVRFLAGCLARSDPARESLWVAHVDKGAYCLHVSHYQGDQTGAAFPVRAIVADAAIRGSAGILLAHNHPSGDPRPSRADCLATRRLAITADALGCRLIDHWVFAGGACSSLRQLGYL